MPQNHSYPHPRATLALRGEGANTPEYNLPAPYATVAYHRRPDNEAGTLGDYWHILAKRKGLLALVTLLCTGAGYLVTRVESPVYRARTLVEIESLNNDFLNMRTVSPNAADEGSQMPPDYNIRTQAMILESRPVLDRAITSANLDQRLIDSVHPSRWAFWRGDPKKLSSASPHDRAMGIALASFKTRAEPNTRVVEATFESTDPQLAADLLNAAASAYAQLNLDRRWQASQETGVWLTRQLADVKTKLERAEDSMQTYANDADLTLLSGKDSTAEERLRQLQIELLRAQADRVVKQAAFEQANSASPESLPQVLDDTTLKAYQEQLTSLRRDLAKLNTQFTPESPKVQDVQAQIAALESALQRKRTEILGRIRNEYAAATQRENLLTADYARQSKLVSNQASKMARYSNLKHEVDSTGQLYESLTQKVREAGLASAMRASNARVIEAAVAPRLPLTPNVWINTAFGLITGLCFGAFLIVRRARAYHGIQAPGEVSVQLNVPELGVIPASSPRFARVRRLLGKETKVSLELTTSEQESSPLAGSFRFALASILLAENNGNAPRAIVVSSANPGEGKTTVISNLAIALAQVNRRVLLIDADWRKPRLHDVFEIDNNVGLEEALSSDPSAAVRPTKVPNLFLLPSGTRTDERLFFNAQLQHMIGRLRKDFDMILIDTPPLLRMSEARMIGRQADAVILVVAQHTDRDAVALAERRLREDGSYLLGTILNNWDPKTSVNGDSAYGDYYYRTESYYGSVRGAHA